MGLWCFGQAPNMRSYGKSSIIWRQKVGHLAYDWEMGCPCLQIKPHAPWSNFPLHMSVCRIQIRCARLQKCVWISCINQHKPEKLHLPSEDPGLPGRRELLDPTQVLFSTWTVYQHGYLSLSYEQWFSYWVSMPGSGARESDDGAQLLSTRFKRLPESETIVLLGLIFNLPCMRTVPCALRPGPETPNTYNKKTFENAVMVWVKIWV